MIVIVDQQLQALLDIMSDRERRMFKRRAIRRKDYWLANLIRDDIHRRHGPQ